MKVARGRPLRRGIVRWGLVSSVQLGTSMALGCGTGAPVETGAETRGTGEPTTSGATAGTTELDATATSTTSGGDDSGVAPPWLDFPADCSMFEQDCPPGYKCVPFSNDGVWFNDTKCSPLVDDPAGPGEACRWIRGTTIDGIDDCDATSFCWFLDLRSGEGTCVELCGGTAVDPTCTQACDWCDSKADQAINLCTFLCDPVAQNCPPGEACVLDGSAYSCQPDGAPPGTTVGSPCDSFGCAAGMVCVPSDQLASCGSSDCCTPFCSMDGPDLCPGVLPGTVCTQVQDPQWLPPGCGAETAGVCLLAPS